MCIIRYCGVSKSWWSTDGYKVKFNLSYPGWKFNPGIVHFRNEIEIATGGTHYKVWFWGVNDVPFQIYKDEVILPDEVEIPVLSNVDVFEIKRGHPAYDFFKKEMNRDGVVHLKPLDATEQWQSY